MPLGTLPPPRGYSLPPSTHSPPWGHPTPPRDTTHLGDTPHPPGEHSLLPQQTPPTLGTTPPWGHRPPPKGHPPQPPPRSRPPVPGRKRRGRAGRGPGRGGPPCGWVPAHRAQGRTWGARGHHQGRGGDAAAAPTPLRPGGGSGGGSGSPTRSAALLRGHRPRSRCPGGGAKGSALPRTTPPQQPWGLSPPHTPRDPPAAPPSPRRCPGPRLSRWARTCPGSAASSGPRRRTCRAGGPGGLPAGGGGGTHTISTTSWTLRPLPTPPAPPPGPPQPTWHPRRRLDVLPIEVGDDGLALLRRLHPGGGRGGGERGWGRGEPYMGPPLPQPHAAPPGPTEFPHTHTPSHRRGHPPPPTSRPLPRCCTHTPPSSIAPPWRRLPPVPSEAHAAAGPVGVPQDAGRDHLPEGLQQRLQLLLVHPRRQVRDVQVGGVLLLLLFGGGGGGCQGGGVPGGGPGGLRVPGGGGGTLAICACTPLAFSAVTAFWAAVGLSKSTKP